MTYREREARTAGVVILFGLLLAGLGCAELARAQETFKAEVLSAGVQMCPKIIQSSETVRLHTGELVTVRTGGSLLVPCADQNKPVEVVRQGLSTARLELRMIETYEDGTEVESRWRPLP